jgi:hypothetical protein
MLLMRMGSTMSIHLFVLNWPLGTLENVPRLSAMTPSPSHRAIPSVPSYDSAEVDAVV